MTLAFIFTDVGFGEWFVLLAVVLIVVGPRNLPSVARKIGSYYGKFRRAAEGFKRQLMDMETEFTRAADAAEREVDEALKVDDEVSGESSAEGASPSPVDPEKEA